ncbi:hypothetical protein GN244_ATG11280 [Phytophthora infestans]|uniref:Uncharacterized protein n=1 Tax=Phytophthora infestans TaxID=4787 RepID=A0A833SLY1_PHYIN|nr:hypothetical protein GN244_ATG11280 [Phytophthora infestans]
MVVNEAEEAKASASLARLRLFLSSHAPNGPGEDRAPSPERSAQEAPKSDEHDESNSETAATPSEPSDIGSFPEVLVDDDDEEEDAGQTTIPAAGAVASVAPMSQSTKEFARVNGPI